MQRLETATVSRKTPQDGRLEITPATAQRLSAVARTLSVRVTRRGTESESPGEVTDMECTCNKSGRSGEHRHHFLSCDLFRSLTPQDRVVLDLDAASQRVLVSAAG